jgi:aryl-alcohol dehydrogenase-like predicted oxidoreductase
MTKRPLGRSGLQIAPLVFGGNVFGWTVDEATSFALLDRFAAAGLNAIDTADVYSSWVPSNQGGESEAIIGKWLHRSPGRREQTVVITKVGSAIGPYAKDLSAKHIMAAAEYSLRRLQTDYIDLYLSHWADPGTPIEESLRAYEDLIRQGKVKAIGSSNYDASQLREALTTAAKENLPRYTVHQPEYNLYDRSSYDGALRDLCIEEDIGVISYFSLASGFLSGKYRSKNDLGKSARGQMVARYLDDRGLRILEALDTVAQARNVTQAEVALAWLIARDGITAPIASATTIEQVDSLIRATQLSLSTEEQNLLSTASD